MFLLLGGSKLHDYRTLLFLCSEVSHFVLESKVHFSMFLRAASLVLKVKREHLKMVFVAVG
ncbi:hypothetical protein, partial [Vibrio splendidus]|uniref:hypothetical protein n=1 Tax=Vibrio splendidus TaxID=29497 RepID=UPI001C964FDC